MSRRVGFISPHAVLGEPAEVRKPAPIKGYHIADTATVQEFCRVHRGTYRNTMIGPDVWLMAGVHIGHDVVVQEGTEIAPGAVICGEVTIGPWAKIGANATVLPGRVIGQRARVGAGAVVTHDVPPGETWAGNPARRLKSSQEVTFASTAEAYEAYRFSDEHAPTTPLTESPRATSTSPASPTPSSAPETPSPATDADELWWEWLARRDMLAKRTTLPARPPGGFIEPSAQHAHKPARSLPSNYVGTCRTPERAKLIAESGHWPHICAHCGYAELAGKQWDYGEWYGKGWVCSTCAPDDDAGDGGW